MERKKNRGPSQAENFFFPLEDGSQGNMALNRAEGVFHTAPVWRGGLENCLHKYPQKISTYPGGRSTARYDYCRYKRPRKKDNGPGRLFYISIDYRYNT